MNLRYLMEDTMIRIIVFTVFVITTSLSPSILDATISRYIHIQYAKAVECDSSQLSSCMLSCQSQSNQCTRTQQNGCDTGYKECVTQCYDMSDCSRP